MFPVFPVATPVFPRHRCPCPWLPWEPWPGEQGPQATTGYHKLRLKSTPVMKCNDIQRYATNTPIWNDSNSQHLWFTVDLLMLNQCTPCLKTRLSPSYGYGIRIGSVGPKRALWTSGDHQEVSDVQFVDWNLPPQQLVRAKTYRTNQIWVCQCHIGNQVQYDLINWWVSRDISHVVKCGEKMLPHSLFHAQEEEFQNAACRTKRTKATPNIPNLFWTFKRTILIAIDCIN